MELAICFLLSALFTLAISFGYGKKLTETPYGRPVLGAVGFFIVIAGYSWEQRNFEMFQSLVFWFIICCFPVLMGGIISGVMDKQNEDAARDSRETQKEIEQYNPAKVGGNA